MSEVNVSVNDEQENVRDRVLRRFPAGFEGLLARMVKETLLWTQPRFERASLYSENFEGLLLEGSYLIRPMQTDRFRLYYDKGMNGKWEDTVVYDGTTLDVIRGLLNHRGEEGKKAVMQHFERVLLG